MASKQTRYTTEFKRQVVELERAGRTPASLGREFGPSAHPIGRWVKQAKREQGRGDGGLTSAERAELTRLRSANRTLRQERDTFSRAAAWFAGEGAPSQRSSNS